MKRSVLALVLMAGSLFGQTVNSSKEATSQPQGSTTPGLGAQSAAESETAVAKPKIDPTKEADIRQFMELAGVSQLALQLMDGMEKNIRPLMVNAFPPGAYREQLIDLFFAKFHQKATPKQILDLAVPVYDKYYSDEDIKGLIKFYQSPLGKKLAATQPKLSAEIQEIGKTWGENAGRDSMTEVLAEHPELAEAIKAAQKPLLPPE
jgi:hypothetical protein